MDIFTTDYRRHTAEMVVGESLWQLHTLIVINSWWQYVYKCMHIPSSARPAETAYSGFMTLAKIVGVNSCVSAHHKITPTI